MFQPSLGIVVEAFLNEILLIDLPIFLLRESRLIATENFKRVSTESRFLYIKFTFIIKCTCTSND